MRIAFVLSFFVLSGAVATTPGPQSRYADAKTANATVVSDHQLALQTAEDLRYLHRDKAVICGRKKDSAVGLRDKAYYRTKEKSHGKAIKEHTAEALYHRKWLQAGGHYIPPTRRPFIEDRAW